MINNQPSLPFEPRVALASLSGQSDAAWARQANEYVGAAMLGGIALDEPTRTAARALVKRDRDEFLPADPVAFIDNQLSQLADESLVPGFNVRTTTQEPLAEAATVCASHGAVLELNAHCRQSEMCAAGAGEALLRDVDALTGQVETATGAGATVSVKVRAEVPDVSLVEIGRQIEDAGATIIHIDAMDTESVIGSVRDSTDLFIIANNEVRDRDSVVEYLEYGADAVSIGRPSDNPAVLATVREAADDWFDGQKGKLSAESARQTS